MIKQVSPLRKILFSAMGMSRFSLYTEELLERPYQSSKELEEFVFYRLSNIVKYAYEHSVYYRELWDSHGIKPQDLKSVEDLKLFPIITKQMVRQNVEKMVSNTMLKSKLIKASTGGSTGEPMPYYQNQDYIELAQAVLHRTHSYLGVSPDELVAWVVGYDEPKGIINKLRRQTLPLYLGRKLFINAFQFLPENIENIFHIIEKNKPVAFYGYASSIYCLAKFMRSSGRKLSYRIKAVFTTAEKLLPEHKKIITEIFNCPIGDTYACREVLQVASTCKKGNLHINEDMNFVEVVPDSSDKKLVTLTAFHNLAMPLIRYQNGDIAEEGQAFCDCGINFKTLSLKIGRVSDNFVTPEGKIVHGEYFTHLMYDFENVNLFQFHQISKGNIVLYIVRGKRWDEKEERMLYGLQRKIAAEISPNIKLDSKFVAEIPKTPMGKHLFTISNVWKSEVHT